MPGDDAVGDVQPAVPTPTWLRGEERLEDAPTPVVGHPGTRLDDVRRSRRPPERPEAVRGTLGTDAAHARDLNGPWTRAPGTLRPRASTVGPQGPRPAPSLTSVARMKGLPPQAPGSGFGALGYALRHLTPTGRPVGGSGALTDALASAVRVAGGSIRTGVAAIRCSAERVDGVELDDGERIAAPLVVGAGDPRTLFIDLLDATSPAARRLQTR